MPHGPVSPVEIHGKTLIDPLKDLGQRNLSRFHQEMHVVPLNVSMSQTHIDPCSHSGIQGILGNLYLQ
jgi:hypothetical protein